MSTRALYKHDEIVKSRSFSQSRTTIETAFYGNNVQTVTDLTKAYEMAKAAPGTIETDMPIF